MKILFDNILENGEQSATNESLNYPASNLVHPFLRKRFQSTGQQSTAKLIAPVVGDIDAIAHGYTNAEKISAEIYKESVGVSSFISQAYTNEVTSPTDLTGLGWVDASSGTAVLSDQSINGNLFTKLTSNGSSYARDYGFIANYFTNTQILIYAIARKDNADSGQAIIFAYQSGTVFLQMTPNFSNQTMITGTGTELKFNFIDDDTVEMWGLTAVFDVTIATEVRAFASGAGNSILFTDIMAVDDNSGTIFPFIIGSKTADVIDETFSMPDKFTIRTEFNNNFAYDTSTDKIIHTWYIDSTHFLRLIYVSSADIYQLQWQDGTNLARLSSQTFDDGTSLTNINQFLDVVMSIDTTSGGTNNSRFIVIPQESGALHEDALWNLTPDVKSSTFPTLSIGHASGANQADSAIDYIRIYDGLLVGSIASSGEASVRLAAMTQLFEWKGDPLFNGMITGADGYVLSGIADLDMTSDPGMTYFDKIEDVKKVELQITGPDPVYLGGAAAGEPYTMPDPLGVYTPGNIDNSSVTESPYGQTLQNYIEPLRALDFGFKDNEGEIKKAVDADYKAVGVGKPIYMDFYEENRDKESPMYGKIVNPLSFPYNPRRYDFNLQVQEAR